MEDLRSKFSASMSLGWSRAFAFEIAHFRRSDLVEPRDLLGGLYVVSIEFPRLASYWSDWRDFAALAYEECGVTGARILYWLPPIDPRKVPRRGLYWPFGQKGKSAELEAIYSAAEQLAVDHPAGRSEGKPLLTTEHVLLAFVKRSDLEISRKLAASSLDPARVKAALTSPKGLL